MFLVVMTHYRVLSPLAARPSVQTCFADAFPVTVQVEAGIAVRPRPRIQARSLRWWSRSEHLVSCASMPRMRCSRTACSKLFIVPVVVSRTSFRPPSLVYECLRLEMGFCNMKSCQERTGEFEHHVHWSPLIPVASRTWGY